MSTLRTHHCFSCVAIVYHLCTNQLCAIRSCGKGVGYLCVYRPLARTELHCNEDFSFRLRLATGMYLCCVVGVG